MPLISTTGGGSVRGFGRGQTKFAFEPFTLNLTAPVASRFGDDQNTVNNFWANAPSSAADVLENLGLQTHTGYYACTTKGAVILSAACGGAAGWRNTNGRSISATFSIPAATRIVFFAGKPTVGTGVQGQGAGGGASILATHANGNFTPLIVAAGGSASYTARRPELGAQALSLTSGAIPNTERNNFTEFTYPAGPNGGVGRGIEGQAQSGGAGWLSSAFLNNGEFDTNGPDALSSGARGGNKNNANGSDGGFGGGGGDRDTNSFGAGGGGYYGGFENASSLDPKNLYEAYTDQFGNFQSAHCGPLSYVAPEALSFLDNGFHGSTSDSQASNGQTGGLVQLLFEAG